MQILILSRSQKLYSTKRLYEEAILAKHETSIVDYMHCHIVSEKNKPSVNYNGQNLNQYDAIIPRIGSTFTYYGSVLIRQFEKQNMVTLMSSKALTKSRDKLHCLQELTCENIGIPKTIFTHYLYNIDEIITTLGGFPFVMKQLEGTQGNGVFLIKNRKHAAEIIKMHQSANKKFILQEFIAEAKGADVRAFVVGNKVVAAMKRQAKNGEFRSNLHQGGKGEKIALTEEQSHAAIIATKKMGLAVAGVDMLLSRRGPLIIEVNASPGLEGIEKTSGINIAQKIIQHTEKIL